jgi:Laminin G domain.
LAAGETFSWSHPSSDKSYYLCNQKWHNVKVVKSGQTLSIMVDDIMTYGGGSVDASNKGVIKGSMFVGGIKGLFSKIYS